MPDDFKLPELPPIEKILPPVDKVASMVVTSFVLGPLKAMMEAPMEALNTVVKTTTENLTSSFVEQVKKP